MSITAMPLSVLLSSVPYFVFFKRMIRPIFTLVKHTPAFKAYQRMPPAFFNVQHPWGAIRIQSHPFRFIAIIIIEHPLNLASQDHHRFRRCTMSVYRHHRPGLQSIEHPLRAILWRVPKIQIHPQPRRSLGRCGQLIQYLLIDNQFFRIN